MTGYLDDERADRLHRRLRRRALNLRWPTAREMSGPWLRALAAGRPTVIIDLAHLVGCAVARSAHVDAERAGPCEPAEAEYGPVVGPVRTQSRSSLRRHRHPGRGSLAAAGDAAAGARTPSCAHARRRRTRLLAARAFDRRRMIDDYRALLAAAARATVPRPSLPAHLVNDGEGC